MSGPADLRDTVDVARTVFTIGHSTRSADELTALLRGCGVACLVDVRAFPRSRTNPQFNIETFPETLGCAGVRYHHSPGLGGRRGRQRLSGDSPNGYWRDEGFRNFADYALTPAFDTAFRAVLGIAATAPAAIMCAEAAWQRCHRQIIADWLLAAGWEVRHILGAGRIEPARLTPGALVSPEGAVRYPPAQPNLL